MLAEAQARLEAHFSSLADERKQLGHPTYVLEHGIDPADIDVLRSALTTDLLNKRSPNSNYWLVWIAVAAEVGYAFDGDEYWRTFARKFDGWQIFGDRNIIRRWFERFANEYVGFRPTGAWARHFSIIAWPISHSILPRDLQGQFARHIYNLRFELGNVTGAAISEIGELLKSRSHNGSSRFVKFLEQTELTGRLVLALRDEDIQDSATLIHAATLARIARDLEERHSSRDWLRDARTVLRDARTRVAASLDRQGEPSRKSNGHTRITSDLRLVGRQLPDESWSLGVKLPDIEALLDACGIKPAALKGSSMALADRPEIWQPASALLAMSKRDRRLNCFPDSSAPYVILNPPIKSLDAILGQLTVHGDGPWLLRLQADGKARQVKSGHVRANERYLLVSRTPIEGNLAESLKLKRQQVLIEGITAYEFAIPSQLSPAFLAALDRLGVGHVVQVVIEPVGLVPRWDDEADATVWLANEEPLLRLTADMAIEEFVVGVDNDSWTHIPVHGQRQTTIALGHLPIGAHTVEVRATASASGAAGQSRHPDPVQMRLEVRAPVPWMEGVATCAGFRIATSPPNAQLPAMVSGKASLEIAGPAGRVADIGVEQFDVNGHLAAHESLGRLTLPAETPRLHGLVGKLGKDPLSEFLQSSSRVDLVVSIEELGRASISFVQDLKPLRWKIERGDEETLVRLIDETGNEDDISIHRYDIETPARRSIVQRAECLDGIPLRSPGALFTARHDGRRYSAIVSVPPAHVSSFADLALNISIPEVRDTNYALRVLIALYRLWENANPLGPLGSVRRGMVLEHIEYEIAAIAGGRNWADRMRKVLSDGRRPLDRLRREVGGSPGFAHRMIATDWTRPVDGMSPSQAFANWAATYRISKNRALSEIAFQIAFHPGSVRFSGPDKGASTVSQLLRVPRLVRGAYLARAACEKSALAHSDMEAA